jgi:uncharacterized protein
MTQAQALYHLQQIELEILRSQKRLEEITTLLTDSTAVAAAQKQVEAATKSLSPLRAKVRDLDLEIQSNTQKAKSTEQQLYSGSVKNPKALQDMQQELEALKTWQGTLEDRLLEAMVNMEDAESTLKNAESELEKMKTEFESKHVDLIKEQADLKAKVEGLQAKRQTALKEVTPESLKLYNTMKPRKNNQPMALMDDVGCQFCGVEQTMNIVQDVRRGQSLIPCTSCGRILVYKP